MRVASQVSGSPKIIGDRRPENTAERIFSQRRAWPTISRIGPADGSMSAMTLSCV